MALYVFTEPDYAIVAALAVPIAILFSNWWRFVMRSMHHELDEYILEHKKAPASMAERSFENVWANLAYA